MRIISKFRDYYDGVSSYGIDLDCVYARESKLIEFQNIAGNTTQKKLPFLTNNIRRNFSSSNFGQIKDVKPLVIGFCGDFFPVIKVETDETNGLTTSTCTFFFYDFDSYIRFMRENNVLFSKHYHFNYNREEVRFDVMDERSAKDFFNYKFKELEIFFIQHHVPMFIYSRNDSTSKNQIETNIKLIDYHFGKVKDPASCFQDIFMYLSGVLGNIEKELIQISDKDMLKQKGFDNWSFKTMPTKRKS